MFYRCNNSLRKYKIVCNEPRVNIIYSTQNILDIRTEKKTTVYLQCKLNIVLS